MDFLGSELEAVQTTMVDEAMLRLEGIFQQKKA
jgi:hypothetical protein